MKKKFLVIVSMRNKRPENKNYRSFFERPNQTEEGNGKNGISHCTKLNLNTMLDARKGARSSKELDYDVIVQEEASIKDSKRMEQASM